jgi:hypothetical protein
VGGRRIRRRWTAVAEKKITPKAAASKSKKTSTEPATRVTKKRALSRRAQKKF